MHACVWVCACMSHLHSTFAWWLDTVGHTGSTLDYWTMCRSNLLVGRISDCFELKTPSVPPFTACLQYTTLIILLLDGISARFKNILCIFSSQLKRKKRDSLLTSRLKFWIGASWETTTLCPLVSKKLWKMPWRPVQPAWDWRQGSPHC